MTSLVSRDGSLVHKSFAEQGPASTLCRFWEDLRYTRDTIGYYGKKQAEPADPFCARFLSGDYWGTGRPEIAREIFSAPPDTFDEPQGVRVLEPLLGPRSVLLLGNDEHRRDRKLLMPPFHGERMRTYGQSIAECVHRRLSPYADAGVFSLGDVAAQISLDVILEAVFGVFGEQRDELSQRALEAIHAFSVPLIFFRFLRRPLLGLSPWVKFQRALGALDETLLQLIDERRTSGQRGDDVLSMLLDARYEDGSTMSAQHLRDELVTLIMAGHETSAIALCWAVDHLHRHPDVLQRLRAELDSVAPDDLEAQSRLPYLQAVCSETLRLHPIVPNVARKLARPLPLGAQGTATGDQVVVSIVLLHRAPELYPEPERFRPERFLERTFKPWEYCPFGGGHKRCLGAAFALYEMQLSLATLLLHFELELLDRRPPQPVRRNVTMGPEGKVPVRIFRRPGAASLHTPASGPAMGPHSRTGLALGGTPLSSD